ncbi:MAG: hypothetical protein H0A76_00915 [Candidatus Thiodubiliella endoseptemdiera]|uniref:Uncharacterized protein n=1 Tax=Candidatus Thiodubiliella endoseptemdiera TaxID=2738886 RepID=A0A853F1T2_9GAMM|nr:hypothetical protein [Candidatus Thiodubiliella endoseptemdiera]
MHRYSRVVTSAASSAVDNTNDVVLLRNLGYNYSGSNFNSRSITDADGTTGDHLLLLLTNGWYLILRMVLILLLVVQVIYIYINTSEVDKF